MTSLILVLAVLLAGAPGLTVATCPFPLDNPSVIGATVLKQALIPLLQAKEFDNVLACIAAVTPLAPSLTTVTLAVAHELAGVAYSSKNLHKEAAGMFVKALKAGVDVDRIATNLGHCLHHLGDSSRASKAYLKAIKANPLKLGVPLNALLREKPLGRADFPALVGVILADHKEWVRPVADRVLVGAGDQARLDDPQEDAAAADNRADTGSALGLAYRPSLKATLKDCVAHADKAADDAAAALDAGLAGEIREGALGDHDVETKLFERARSLDPRMDRAVSILEASLKKPGSGIPMLHRMMWVLAQDALASFHGSEADMQAMKNAVSRLALTIATEWLERRSVPLAVNWLIRALRVDDRNTGAYNNLGGVLRISGDLDLAREALEAGLLRSRRKSHELHQGLSFVHSSLGNTEKARTHMKEAIAQFPRAQYYAALGALYGSDEIQERVANYDAALELDENNLVAFCNRAETYKGAALWDELARDMERLVTMQESVVGQAGQQSVIGEHCLQPFHTTYMPVPMSLQKKTSEWWGMREAVSASALSPLPAPPLSNVPPARKLVIGYMSSDFGKHPLGRFVRDLFAAHDRTRVEVHCIALASHEGPENEAIRSGCDSYTDVSAIDAHADAAHKVRDLGLDILIDFNGWTKGRRPRILAHRPAPIQVLHGWGFIGTSGMPFIDYFIGDSVVSPVENDQYHTEKLLRLPHTYFPASHRRVHPAKGLSGIDVGSLRDQMGVPRDAVLAANFQSVSKMSAAALDSWCKIVGQAGESVVLMLLKPSSQDTEDRLSARCAAAGAKVDTQLVFANGLDPDLHIKRMLAVDLFLDSDEYGAHSTGADALWAGVPLLTFPGEKLCSRVGKSMLESVGLANELSVADRAAFEAKALSLLTNKAELARLRTYLESGRETFPLFDVELYARDLERGLLDAFALYAENKPLRAITVGKERIEIHDEL